MSAIQGDVLQFDAAAAANAGRVDVEAEVALLVQERLEDVYGRLHAPLASLRLAAYACDAMRVLNDFERHGSSTSEQMLRSICPDWRNPLGLEPENVIAEVLQQVISEIETTTSLLNICKFKFNP